MTSTDRMEGNLTSVVEAYQRAVREQSQLVVFPENSLFFRIQSGSNLQGPALDGPELKRLAQLVDEHKSALMLTTAVQAPSKFHNSTILFQPGRAPHVVYSKIHLFDVDVPGAPPVRESDHFAAGDLPAVVEIDGWKFGLTICYDLRFAELFLNYSQKVDCILVPSAFLVPTGEAHWQVLMRARAIESQCYVAAPAQAGEHESSGQRRHTYGHSMVVDPWGRIVTELGAKSGTEVKTVALLKDQIEKVRRQIPMAGHRRVKRV